MMKYERILEKAIKNNGFYDTRKYRYYIVSGLHTCLVQIEKDILGTTAALKPENHRHVFTIL